MTTQPKLPEWANVKIVLQSYTISGENYLKVADVYALASRLMAEIVPEGYCVVPIESRESDYDNPGPAAEPCKYCNEVHKDSRLACAAEYRAKQAEGGGKRSSSYKRCSMCDTDCAPDYPCMCPCHEGASHER